MNEQMNERMNEWTNEQTNEWTNDRTNICISWAPDRAKRNKSTSPEVILRCGTGTDDADINNWMFRLITDQTFQANSIRNGSLHWFIN